MYTTQNKAKEKAILIRARFPGESELRGDESLKELASLAETAGAEVIGIFSQRLSHPVAPTFIGGGKLAEIKSFGAENGGETVIFDHDLSPGQIRNLERVLDMKVLDRSQLILDIFALRARTKEARVQVELAQLQYLLPRLGGMGHAMSREGGGIGTRGPGETKIETDRRRIRKRIGVLKKELLKIAGHRELLRERRHKNQIPSVALAGYTNAGKSALFNAVFARQRRIPERVHEEGKPFATLDTTTRRITTLSGREFLLSDTVGFIQNLPTHLVAAFKSTLEEITAADVILHVVDASNPYYLEQMVVVAENLKELGAVSRPVIIVYNKIDLLERKPCLSKNPFEPSVAVSAKTGEGIEKLLEYIEGFLK